jgi:hypothetical protein
LLAILIHLLLAPSTSSSDLRVVESGAERVSIRVDDRLASSWILTPELAPDEYLADIVNDEPAVVSFITDVDSIDCLISVGDTCEFVIRWNGQDCWTRVVGRRFIPAASFDAVYRGERRGRIFVSVPEVYELVNVAIALTSTGRSDPNLVYQNSAYYTTVMDYFGSFGDHELVQAFGEVIDGTSGYYDLKMNAFAFEFDDTGRIVSRREFDRTGFRNQRENRLRPYLALMQSFAEDTHFRDFYSENRDVYERQVACLRDSLDLGGMRRWLDENFPSGSDYDTYNIVFSPLVAYNQSTTWFESNGFRELQPHVNFPYVRDLARLEPLSTETELVYRGNIVFTELNHGYINPVGDRYGAEIAAATSDRNLWVDADRGAEYYGGRGLFLEYLNWGLVSLRISDLVALEEQEKLIQAVEASMTDRRGFPRFAEFDQFLLELYRNRDEGETLEDLYPRIIIWFAEYDTTR